MELNTPLTQILKLTKPQVAAFKKLGLITAQDLLLHLPYRYLDFSKTVQIKDIKPGESISLKVKILSISKRFSFRSRMSLAEALVGDDSGNLKIIWFNQGYIADALKKGEEIFLAGTPEYYKFSLQLTNPLYEKVSDFPVHTARLVPVYHLTQNLYPRTIRNAVKTILPLASKVADVLPLSARNENKLLPAADAIRLSHFPNSLDEVEAATRRFNFEEIFISQLAIQKLKLERNRQGAYKIKFDQPLVKTFVNSLPFTLTAEQKQAAWDILQDMEKPAPMNRLLEGDVGSGKTLVALIAALEAITQNYQIAFLAPTEILAKQHYETAKKFLWNKFYGHKIYSTGLLTGSVAILNGEANTKKDLQKTIGAGKAGIFFGTHALLEDKVKFKKLALVIIDEQHRFGVNQRSALTTNQKKVPHLISLSATPIPRTLKLALGGELDISQITTKPTGRKPIISKLVGETGRPKAYQFVFQEIKKGRQAFIITPLIEENDSLGVKSAKKEHEAVQKIFSTLKVGLLHGKLKPKDKEAVMQEFLQNKTQILVATSVVEVGVDVPNASVMLIEGAERFGLSQLHQFRGRVGRSEHQSYCFLFISTNKNTPSPLTGEEQGEGATDDGTLKRLQSFTQTQDGFKLAELDLKQRGFGTLFGSQQSGWDYKYFDPAYIALIPAARQAAEQILSVDNTLEHHPLLLEKISGKTVHLE